VLDLGHNRLVDLRLAPGSLSKLRKLLLHSNRIRSIGDILPDSELLDLHQLIVDGWSVCKWP